MAGRSGLLATLAREQRRAEANRKRNLREREQAIRQALRAQGLVSKEAKQRYLAQRTEATEDLNADLAEQIKEIKSILEHTLSVDDTISFDSLQTKEDYPNFYVPASSLEGLSEPSRNEFLSKVKAPSGIGRLIPGTQEKYTRAMREAEAEFDAALMAYQERKQGIVANLQAEYEKQKQAFIQQAQAKNREIDELENAYRSGDASTIVAYNSMVLERSEYPDNFPQEFRLAYLPESKELVIEYELPSSDVIPAVTEYKYVKSRDAIEEKARKPAEIKELYQDVVSAICLRTIHEVLEADQGKHLDVVVFNGFVQTVDPATGKDIQPHLISARVTKNQFIEINLARVDKRTCLRNLGAQVSPRPAEMLAIKPIIEFDMVDKRFVEQSDILSDLESRPNLMELNPFEFENLVSNLFSKMGLETRLTQASRDGGVDAVAFDLRPVLGGKVVIQAKRYKNVVGVSAVRDLYGTMMNEGANKGILVTTSNYGPDAYEFAKDKPIELMDGGALLYHLEQVGVKARIVFPTEG